MRPATLFDANDLTSKALVHSAQQLVCLSYGDLCVLGRRFLALHLLIRIEPMPTSG